MLDLNSTIELDVNKFLRWWTQELAFLLPDKVKNLINDNRGVMIIRPVNEGFLLSYEQNDEQCGSITLSANEQGLADYRQFLLQHERSEKARIIVRLKPEDAVSTQLQLPLAAAANLQQIMHFELDRYTPFKPDQVYFSAQLTGKQPEFGVLTVKLVVATKDKLDALCTDLKALTIVPELIEYELEPNQADSNYDEYNLLPDWVQPKNSNFSTLVYTGLCGLFFALFIAVFAMPVFWQGQVVDEFKQTLRTVGKSALKVEESQDEIDRLLAASNVLIQEKKSAPSMLEILDTLSELIPDDTWLSQLQFTGKKLQLRGQSASASTLITLLERSNLFTHAKFVSPVNQDKVSGLERFQLSLEIAERAEDE